LSLTSIGASSVNDTLHSAGWLLRSEAKIIDCPSNDHCGGPRILARSDATRATLPPYTEIVMISSELPHELDPRPEFPQLMGMQIRLKRIELHPI
jgi:hypothetical protein